MTQCQISSPLSEVMNPIEESTYDFLASFLQYVGNNEQLIAREMSELFTEPFLHLGGDEVNPACWENNTDIVNWMADQGMTEPIQYVISSLSF